jgi:predicted metal-dependent enzyme (double-stranded beta helix superfamily)
MTKQQSFTSLTRRAILAGGAASLLPIQISARETGSMAQSKPISRAFDRERFVADCVAAHRADGMPAVREVLASALSDHASVLRGLGGPTQAGLDVMHTSPEFTIFAAHWTPQMNLLPHDHMMEALIGIYTGREDNILWKQGEDGIEASEVNCLFEGDIAQLPADAIHSVTNPLLRFTGGIHIYDGDFFATERHQWDPETLAEEPSDGDAIRAMFARENERYFAKCES